MHGNNYGQPSPDRIISFLCRLCRSFGKDSVSFTRDFMYNCLRLSDSDLLSEERYE